MEVRGMATTVMLPEGSLQHRADYQSKGSV